jgi:hypothetical protein
LAKKFLEELPLERPRIRWVGSINMGRKLTIRAQHQNDCAGEDRQQFTGLDWIGWYIQDNTKGAKKSLAL